MPGPSTLITSRKSQADFAARLVFFAVAPLGILAAMSYFPVAGALISVVLALLVFLFGEAVRAAVASRRIVGWLLDRELALAAYYQQNPPRPFLYYVFFPLLFPYWIVNREARREFLLFKGYTLGSFAILLATTAYQYFTAWRPELGPGDFARVVGITLGIETLLVAALLMPIATTVMGFHERRRRRLVALLLVALASTTVGVVRLVSRRDPVVSFATRTRVRLRTRMARAVAHEAHLAGLRAAWSAAAEMPSAVDVDGKVLGPPLERAHEALAQSLYKADEAFSFDLWATPPSDPTLLVLYFEARPGHPPIWAAMMRSGEEVADAKQLPRGAFRAMKRAADDE